MGSKDLAVENEPYATSNGVFNWADNVEEAVGPLHSVTRPDTQSITRAIAQGIAGTGDGPEAFL